MTLTKVHRILIASGIVLGVLMVLFAGVRWLGQGDASYLPTGALGAVSTVGLALYLRWFSKKQAERKR